MSHGDLCVYISFLLPSTTSVVMSRTARFGGLRCFFLRGVDGQESSFNVT